MPYSIDYLSDRLYWGSGGTPRERARINLSYVNNPQLNSLLEKQAAEFDVAARKTIVREIEAICAEEQYEIYFGTDTRTYFWSPDIENYRPSQLHPLREPQADAAGLVDMSASPTAPDLAAQLRDGEDFHYPELSHFIPMQAPDLVARHVRELLSGQRPALSLPSRCKSARQRP